MNQLDSFSGLIVYPRSWLNYSCFCSQRAGGLMTRQSRMDTRTCVTAYCLLSEGTVVTGSRFPNHPAD